MERDIIGLGKNCFVAKVLSDLRIMKRRDELDDLATNNLGELATALSKEFEGFFGSLDDLDFYGTCRSGTKWFVKDKISGIISAHHWRVGSDKDECYRKFIKTHDMSKLVNRIKTAHRPLILRTNTPTTKLEEVMYLHDVIADLRQNRDFVLCVFQDAVWADNKWDDIPSLMTFRIQVFEAHAERYPDNSHSIVLDMRYPRYAIWQPIFNYIFDELGMTIKARNPAAIKM